MATIDIELEDFSTADLIAELSERLTKKSMRQLSRKERERVSAALNDMTSSDLVLVIPLTTVDDQAKKEIVLKAWSQNNSFQLEEKLK